MESVWATQGPGCRIHRSGKNGGIDGLHSQIEDGEALGVGLECTAGCVQLMTMKFPKR
jgi:hypothetical protein